MALAGIAENNMDKLIHHNSLLNGQTVKWWPTDSEEQYQSNINTQRSQLEKYNWIDADISYVNNSHGFRTSEFDQQKNFITVGCSYTYGIGLPIDSIWPELLSKQLELPVFNLGVPGGSLDTSYRIIKHYVPLLKPKHVILLAPDPSRMEIFINNQPYIHLPSSTDYYGFMQSEWVKQWLTSDENTIVHTQKNIEAMAYICKKNAVNFYVYTTEFFLNLYAVSEGGLARDLMHPGRLYHQKFSKHVYQDIVNNCTYE